MRILYFCVAQFFLGLLFGPTALAENLDELLAKVAEAYGGKGDDGIRAMRLTGTTHAARRGTDGAFLLNFQRPDRLRIEYAYPVRPEVRIINGPQSWINGSPMSSGSHSAMILQAARLDLPWILLEQPEKLRDAGTVQAPDGVMLRSLELPLAPGHTLIAEIDPNSGRILHSRGTMVGTRGTMEFDTIFQDFATQDGRLYAATEIHFAKGLYTGYTKIDKIEFLDALPDDLFAPSSEPGVQPTDQDLRL